MSTVNDTDTLLVNRGGVSYNVKIEDMSTVLDTDILLINRGGASYKVEAKDLPGGSDDIFPSENDITITPTPPGSGTEQDPWILTQVICAPSGSSVDTVETISFTGQPAEKDVKWINNSEADTGERFNQPVGETDASGNWSGKLLFNDNPDSTQDTGYTGQLQIGTLYFRWVVQQNMNQEIATEVLNVDLVETGTVVGNRFTDQTFQFSSTVVDGFPLATKTIESYVEGAFATSIVPKSSNITTVNAGVLSLTNDTVVDNNTGIDTELTVSEAFTDGMRVTAGSASGTVTATDLSQITVAVDTDPSWSYSSSTGNAPFGNKWAFGNGMYVMVKGNPSEGEMGNVYYSTDKVNWTKATNGVPKKYVDVAFGNGKFVIIGSPTNANDLAQWWGYSTDGINWTPMSAPTGRQALFITYNGGYFWGGLSIYLPGVTPNQGYIFYSTSGTSWSTTPCGTSGDGATQYGSGSGATGGGYMVIGSGGYQMFMYASSSPASGWSQSGGIPDGRYNQGTALATGDDGLSMCQYYPQSGSSTFARSINYGGTWTPVPTSNIDTSNGGPNAGSFCRDPATGRWYAVGDVNTWTSDDHGVSWQLYTGPIWPYDQRNFQYNPKYLSASTHTGYTGVDGINYIQEDATSNPGPKFLVMADAPDFAAGSPVIGESEIINSTKLYVNFNSSGTVSNLTRNPQSPAYTTDDTNPSLTLTFPSTFPSGEAPDTELPSGTTLTVGLKSQNDNSVSPASGFEDVTIQPTPVTNIADMYATAQYAGDSTNGVVVTNGVDIDGTGGLVWIKSTDASYQHCLYDTTRGVNSRLGTNLSTGADTTYSGLQSFTSTGFNMGSGSYAANYDQAQYVSWSFKKQTGFFMVQQGAGTGSATTVPHSLGTVPGAILSKNYTSNGYDWFLWHKDLSTPNTYMQFNRTGRENSSSNPYNNTLPTDTVFSLGDFENNTSGQSYIYYLFGDDGENIKCGSYVGTGSPTQEVTDVGFKPQFLIVKCRDDDGTSWCMCDSTREGFLRAESDVVEQVGGVTFLDNGFRVPTTNGNWNTAGLTYIYIAIAADVVTTMNAADFDEIKLKFATYENRKQVKCGNDALAERDAIIASLVAEGHSLTDVLEYM